MSNGNAYEKSILDPWLMPPDWGQPLPVTHKLRTTYYPEHPFDLHCRSIGARDLFDLFTQCDTDGVILADRVRRTFPSQLGMALQKFFSETNQDNLRQAFSLPPNGIQWAQDENLWNKAINFFKGFIITSIETDKFWVPLFCVRPPQIDGGKCIVDYSKSTSSKSSFNLGVPGLRGGFGIVNEVRTGVSTREFSIVYQVQIKLLCNVITRISKSGDTKYTLVPLQPVGKPRSVTEGDDFIECVDVQRYPIPDSGWISRTNIEEWYPHSIKRGCSDTFKINVPILVFDHCTLAIETTVNEEFCMWYTGPPGEYTVLGARENSHDLEVTFSEP